MRIIPVGILVNTHGLKGEVRIISDFEYKDRIFKIGNHLLVGENQKDLIITSYRKHKNYDMVTFEGYNSINEVNIFKGMKVYYDIDTLKLNDNEYLDNDLIGLDVIYNNKSIGKVENIEVNSNRKLFVIDDKLIPYNENFIELIDIKNRRIILKNLEGLI